MLVKKKKKKKKCHSLRHEHIIDDFLPNLPVKKILKIVKGKSSNFGGEKSGKLDAAQTVGGISSGQEPPSGDWQLWQARSNRFCVGGGGGGHP